MRVVDEIDSFVTVAEAGRLANLSKTTIFTMVRAGEVPVVLIGGKRFIRRSDAERLSLGARAVA